MSDFQDAARKQIESKRNELISPIAQQESQVLLAVDQSYEHAIYANSSISWYLQSIRKVKTAQQEALSMIRLDGVDTLITNNMVKLSDQVDLVLRKGKEIDVQSENAYNQLEGIIKEIKEISHKK